MNPCFTCTSFFYLEDFYHNEQAGTNNPMKNIKGSLPSITNFDLHDLKDLIDSIGF